MVIVRHRTQDTHKREDRQCPPRPVCVLMYLTTLSLTFMLSVFIIYFMIYPGSVTDREEGKQEGCTDMRARPHCLDRQ